MKGPCGCCYECAKQINETCGGLWNYEGTCDVGLKCQYSSSFYAIRPGICTRKGKVLATVLIGGAAIVLLKCSPVSRACWRKLRSVD